MYNISRYYCTKAISCMCTNKIICINGSLRNIESPVSLQYKKTTDSVLLSLFMRTNGKCNNTHAPSTGLSGILFSVRNQYSCEKKSTLYRFMGRSFTNSTQKQRQLLRPLNNLGKRILWEKRKPTILVLRLGFIESVHEH